MEHHHFFCGKTMENHNFLWENYGTWQFVMGKSTISMAIFNSYVTNYQRVVTSWDMIIFGNDNFPILMYIQRYVP